jgi:hypothetical protein
MHRLKAGLEASFACSRLDSKAPTGWPDSVAVILSSIPDQRGTNTKDPASQEKSVKVARRALSTSLNWGKHRLAQEAGLFRGILLHRSIVTEAAALLSWLGYDGLLLSGYKHRRIHHHANEFARAKNHVIGIESFWSYAKFSLLQAA